MQNYSMKQLLTLSFIFLLSSATSFGQSGSKWLFDDSTLPEIRINIDQDSLDEILADENQQSDHEFLATFNITKDGVTETVDSVGFRLRGNTSRASEKKSFKVSFDTFIDGREYRGLDKMNLNGEHNDPTVTRAKLSWNIFEKMEVKAPRSNHVSLYINDVFYGLYLNVEHIDNEFLKKEFNGDSGNLYKCLYPADLSYRGPSSDDYSDYEEFGRRPYDLKTNEEQNDYSGLASFIEFLNNSNDQDFEEQIHDYLNVDATLRWMAIDVLTGNWDNYSFKKNNFYLYHSPDDGRFAVIPYDYDNTLGVDFFGIDWGVRNIYNWGNQNENRPLTNRFLEIQKFKDWFSYYLNETIARVFNEDSLFPEIDRLKGMIQTAAEADTFRTKDWPALDFEDYDKSFVEALGGHVPYGLKPFITERKNTALNQLQLNNIYPIVHSSSSKLLTENGNKTIVVEATVDDEALSFVSAKVDILAILNPFELRDDGQDFDKTAGDGIYTGSKDIGTYSEDINFFVLAQDQEGKTSRYPQNPAKKIRQKNSAVTAEVVINEFMASNSSTIQDESGSFPDWVEIFNASVSETSLSGYFLTDDLSNPDKWAFPDTVIQSEGFLIVWADDDEREGPMHASFNLNKSGEDLGLYKKNGSDFEAINTLTFGEQTTDVSYARDGDGDGPFVFREEPTPGATNGVILSGEDNPEIPETATLYQNYPNPFNPSTTISFGLDKQDKITLQVFNITGQLVQTITSDVFGAGKHSVNFRADNLSSGVYFYRLKTSASTLTRRFTLIK